MVKSRTWREGFLAGYEKGSLETYAELQRLLTSGHNQMEIGVQVRARERTIHQRIADLRADLSPGMTGEVDLIHADIVPGHGYLYQGAEPEPLLTLFSHLTGQGYRGLMIYRWSPEIVKATLTTTGVADHHLTTDTRPPAKPATHQILTPGDLSRVANTIVEWCKGDSPPVVLLQGLEFLAAHNDFIKVYKLLHTVVDRVSAARGILLLKVDAQAWDPTELSKIATEMRGTLGG